MLWPVSLPAVGSGPPVSFLRVVAPRYSEQRSCIDLLSLFSCPSPTSRQGFGRISFRLRLRDLARPTWISRQRRPRGGRYSLVGRGSRVPTRATFWSRGTSAGHYQGRALSDQDVLTNQAVWGAASSSLVGSRVTTCVTLLGPHFRGGQSRYDLCNVFRSRSNLAKQSHENPSRKSGAHSHQSFGRPRAKTKSASKLIDSTRPARPLSRMAGCQASLPTFNRHPCLRTSRWLERAPGAQEGR